MLDKMEQKKEEEQKDTITKSELLFLAIFTEYSSRGLSKLLTAHKGR